MDFGKLRNRIVIQQVAGNTRTDEGDDIPTYATFAQPWADVMGLAGKQVEQGATISSTTTHRIEIRYRAGITPRMRVISGDDVLSINAVVDPDRRRERLFLFCSAKT